MQAHDNDSGRTPVRHKGTRAISQRESKKKIATKTWGRDNQGMKSLRSEGGGEGKLTSGGQASLIATGTLIKETQSYWEGPKEKVVGKIQETSRSKKNQPLRRHRHTTRTESHRTKKVEYKEKLE